MRLEYCANGWKANLIKTAGTAVSASHQSIAPTLFEAVNEAFADIGQGPWPDKKRRAIIMVCA